MVQSFAEDEAIISHAKLNTLDMKKTHLPSVDMLAQLAAIISTKSNRNQPNCNSLVSEAFQIWKAAKEKHEEESEEEYNWQMYNKETAAYLDSFKLPNKFPVGFDEWLGFLMPQVQKRTERLTRFRQFLGEKRFNYDDTELPRRPIGRLKAGDLIAEYRARKINQEEYLGLATQFDLWWKGALPKKRRDAARTA
jgi:hypothetical protein